VSAIVANLQAVETPWKNQLTALQAQDTALTGIGKDLSSLSTALNALNDFEGVFSEKEGSSSDTSVLALTSASAAAVAGSHTVVVGQLAETYSYASGVVAASDTLSGKLSIGGQTITISDGTATDGNGNTIPQNNTLATLASYINDGDYGVQANVVTGSTGQQLSLVSDTSGAAGAVTIDSSQLEDATASTAVSIGQVQQGQDAQVTVDGISTTSSSNTVTDAIPGVTMQLLSAPTSGEQVQVEITNNNSDVESAVSTFVSVYNTVIGDINTQEGSDSSGNPEPLYGNSAVATLQEQLQEGLIFAQSSGAITSLSQLGITANQDGTITLDGSTLDSALNSNFQDAMNFFQANTSYTSFGANFTTTLNNLGNTGPTGAVYLGAAAEFDRRDGTEYQHYERKQKHQRAADAADDGAERSELHARGNSGGAAVGERAVQRDHWIRREPGRIAGKTAEEYELSAAGSGRHEPGGTDCRSVRRDGSLSVSGDRGDRKPEHAGSPDCGGEGAGHPDAPAVAAAHGCWGKFGKGAGRVLRGGVCIVPGGIAAGVSGPVPGSNRLHPRCAGRVECGSPRSGGAADAGRCGWASGGDDDVSAGAGAVGRAGAGELKLDCVAAFSG
jgi:flagellar hook-associated protein 2